MATLFTALYPLLQLDTKKFLSEFAQADRTPIEAGVGVEGPAAAYALVWEWGNIRQTKIGPKTTIGTNPDGERVFLSIQAPHGYIRVNTPLYWAAFEQEIGRLKFTSTTAEGIHEEFQQVVERTASRVRDIIREHVPVDTGQLYDDIRVISAGDDLLDEDEDSNALMLTREV
jgi:hypothetical protein